MLEGFVHESILARAEKKGLAEIRLHNLRDYTLDKWRRVDDYPYGGSAGMVMQCEPIDRCITALKAERDYDEVIFTSPDGERFDQHMANELSMKGNLIILAGHYKGIDQRVRDHLITREISIGDFVLTGGELVAEIIKAGKYLISCYRATKPKYATGNWNRLWNEPVACVLTYSTKSKEKTKAL